MILFKKNWVIISMLIVLVILVIGGILLNINKKEDVKLQGSLEELMDKMYANIPDDEKPMSLNNMEVTKENIENFVGTSDIEFEEALVSEPLIGSIPHSVVLLKLKEGTNVEEVKNKIEQNVDPRKWICVEAEKIIVKNKGNIVILIMSSEDTAKQIQNNFDKL